MPCNLHCTPDITWWFLALSKNSSFKKQIQHTEDGCWTVFPWNWIPESGLANIFIADGIARWRYHRNFGSARISRRDSDTITSLRIVNNFIFITIQKYQNQMIHLKIVEVEHISYKNRFLMHISHSSACAHKLLNVTVQPIYMFVHISYMWYCNAYMPRTCFSCFGEATKRRRRNWIV